MVLALLFGTAKAQEQVVLGSPFPDFTVTDTEGNEFTLSEALKYHEAVLLNIWASWCPPCKAEMPFLEEAYEKYGDQVVFIALSREEDDTLEVIEDFREEFALSFPMGRDEGMALYRYLGKKEIPSTVVIDCFGNAVFTHYGSFHSAAEPCRVLSTFLGEEYTETKVLAEIPKSVSTCAFPVSEKGASMWIMRIANGYGFKRRMKPFYRMPIFLGMMSHI